MTLEKALCWYQERIGLYDKQSWETTVEQHILRGLSYSPCKSAKLKTDLIDVDLVRGSTFPKAKPQSDVWLAGLHGIVRLVLCPLYYRWWITEIKLAGYLLVITMYCSAISASFIYYNQHDDILKNIPWFEVFLPLFLLIILSGIHSQMVCTRRKGIKMTCLSFNNKETLFKKFKTGRKSRSAMRNNVISHSKGKSSYIKIRNRNKSKNGKIPETQSTSTVGYTSLRSHSEDLHTAQTYIKNYRSASESNILHSQVENLTSCRTDSITREVDILNGGNKSQSIDRAGEDIDTGVDCTELQTSNDTTGYHLRFRGSAKGNLSQHMAFNSLSSASIIENNILEKKNHDKSCLQDHLGSPIFNFPLDLEGDQTSDVGSDEGCSADCESPNTDGESIQCNQWASKLNSCIEPRKKVNSTRYSPRKSIPKLPVVIVEPTVSNSSGESEGERGINSHPLFSKPKDSFPGWNGVTTNSEDPSYSSESEVGWDDIAESNQTEPIDWHIQGAPAAVISSTRQVTDKVSCKIWEDSEMKKVSLSVLDIASAVISRVDNLRHSSNYLMFGLVMSGILSIIPCLYRLFVTTQDDTSDSGQLLNETNTIVDQSRYVFFIFPCFLGNNMWSVTLIVYSCLSRLVLGASIFFLLSVAERTFKQRFLYAKHFCYMTSARRARKYDLPHFRLNKVINIKAWLSIRSCLKKRGPQHSIDVIVSATFIVTLILVFYLGVEAIKDDEKNWQPLHNCELFVWCFTVSVYLIRFMTLGALINKKYSNPSVLITEQINMYFHMEQNPEKKDKLVLANNVLKLVSVLLKELDSPFKISGLYANTLLYNITKFGILSACSGVLSNLLGFKLKLHSIKFK